MEITKETIVCLEIKGYWNQYYIWKLISTTLCVCLYVSVCVFACLDTRRILGVNSSFSYIISVSFWQSQWNHPKNYTHMSLFEAIERRTILTSHNWISPLIMVTATVLWLFSRACMLVYCFRGLLWVLFYLFKGFSSHIKEKGGIMSANAIWIKQARNSNSYCLACLRAIVWQIYLESSFV